MASFGAQSKTAQEKTIRGIVFLRKAMSLHEREGVPARETRVLGGIGSAPRQRGSVSRRRQADVGIGKRTPESRGNKDMPI